jgi:hypothetical protein
MLASSLPAQACAVIASPSARTHCWPMHARTSPAQAHAVIASTSARGHRELTTCCHRSLTCTPSSPTHVHTVITCPCVGVHCKPTHVVIASPFASCHRHPTRHQQPTHAPSSPDLMHVIMPAHAPAIITSPRVRRHPQPMRAQSPPAHGPCPWRYRQPTSKPSSPSSPALTRIAMPAQRVSSSQ